MTAFNRRLDKCIESMASHVCVGLDPTPGQAVPGGDLQDFLGAVIDATAAHAVAYKPNIAFYEAMGLEGMRILIETIEHIHTDTDAVVILDVKRGDIAHTAQAYARAAYDVFKADAVTVSPYLGRDSVDPFAERADRGVFVLARTSNQSARDFQDLRVERTGGDGTTRTGPLFLEVARSVMEWNARDNLGLVTGATWPGEIQRIREAVGDGMPFLVPGVGAQGGDARTAARAAADSNGRGFLVNSGRAILQASSGDDYAMAAGRAAAALQHEIATALAAPKP